MARAMVTHRGGDLKVTKEGKVSGYLVRFTDAKTLDLDGEYFDIETDYGFDVGETMPTPIYYHHGLNADIGGLPIGHGTLKITDLGVWIDGELALRERYEELLKERLDADSKAFTNALFDKLISQNKAGWSSGTMPQFTQRTAKGSGAVHIDRWVLGGDASITPTPADSENFVGVKTLDEFKALAHDPLESIFAATPDEAGSMTIITVPPNIPLSITTHTTGGHTMPESQNPPASPETPAAPSGDGAMADLNDIKAVLTGLSARLDAMETPPAPAPTPTPAPAATPAPPDYKAIVREIMEEQQKAFEPQRQIWTPSAPTYVKELGDNFENAFKYWIKTGDNVPLRHMEASLQPGDNGPWDMKGAFSGQFSIALKASNATAMLAGTDAAGGAAVPQGHVDTIVSRRDEMALWRKLGVQQIPGQGLTVHLPVDAEDDGEFASTAERAANDEDSPATDTVAFTLVNYTKRVPVTRDLIDFETSGLLNWLENFVSRGAAKTENNLLLTATAASGTSLVTFASSIAIAFGEPESIIANDDLGDYLDDTPSTAWVMRRSTYYNKILQVTDANNRMYAETQAQSSSIGPMLLGYPVSFSQKVTAIGAQANPSAKAVHFGNFFFVGVRHDPEMRILRDEFSEASKNTINLHYFFRTIYKVIQAEAIGYGVGGAT